MKISVNKKLQDEEHEKWIAYGLLEQQDNYCKIIDFVICIIVTKFSFICKLWQFRLPN